MVSKRSKRGYRITVTVNGRIRQILSITENSNSIGTITIGAMPAQNFRHNLEDKSINITDRKYSIHPNKQSVATNTIHEQVKSLDKIDIDYMTYTKALKVTNCFAPIFARAAADPRPKRYDLRSGGKNKKLLDIGEYDPDETTLMYCILLSPPGLSEVIDRSAQLFSVTSMPLPNFDLTILSSALSGFRSVHMGSILNFDAIEGVPLDRIEYFYKSLVAQFNLLLIQMHGSSMAARFGEHVE